MSYGPQEIRRWYPMKLSENFTLREFTKSMTAERHGIDNTPSEEHLQAAKLLFENVMQPVRNQFGLTIINSGYRGPELNEKVGGSSSSQHCKGEACDFECPPNANGDVATWIMKNLDFDQLILEFYTPGVPDSGWIHCSYKAEGNRKSILTATRSNGKTEYLPGLVL